VVGPTNCLDVDEAATVQATGPDEAGPPIIRSVVFSCPTFVDPDADDFENQTITASGNVGNNGAFTSTLANVFNNGSNEAAVPPVANLSSISAFFVNTSYIGAVRDANDSWYRGWTCDSSYANFGSNRSCLVVPPPA